MRASTPEGLRASLAAWQEIKETEEGFSSMSDELIEEIQRKISLLDSLLDRFRVHGLGLTLKHSKRDAWGVVLADASEAGRFRWQAFQEDGFTGHCTFDSPELCIGDMLDDGYVVPDQGALDRLAGTAVWRRGMEIVALIQACNAGEISWEEASAKREEINARYPEVVTREQRIAA